MKFNFFAGHVIDGISELPLVVSDNIQGYNKTKQAVLFLRRSKLWGDVLKVSVENFPRQTSTAGIFEFNQQIW